MLISCGVDIMENLIILRNVLQDYLVKQTDTDRQILRLLIEDSCKEHDIARITGYPLSKINRTVRKLRVYLMKLNYS